MLESMLGAAVAVGWSGYVRSVLGSFGWTVPNALLTGPFDGGVLDLPALAVVAIAVALLRGGTSESARATNVLVGFKIAALVLFLVVGALYVTTTNWISFVSPNEGTFGEFGWTGVIRGASVVFFAYIGFDAVCSAAQKAEQPRRTVPIEILGSLAITALYLGVAATMTGLVPYHQLVSPDALIVAVDSVGLNWLGRLVDIVAVVALAATVLAGSSGGRGHCGQRCCCAGRRAASPPPRCPARFRVPGEPVIPIIAIVVNLLLVALVPLPSVVRLLAWFAIGIVVFLLVARRRAYVMSRGAAAAP